MSAKSRLVKKLIILAIRMTKDSDPEYMTPDEIKAEDAITAFQKFLLDTVNERHTEYATFHNEAAQNFIMDELAELLDADEFTRDDAARISALFYFLLLG
jgi:hypothetical protein